MARSSATRSKGCTTLARIRYIVAEAYRGFRRNLLLAGSMVIIVAISLTLFGIALLAGKQVNLWGGYWSDKIEVSVFLAKKITPQQREAIGSQIRGLPVVDTVFYESRQQAYQRFNDQVHDLFCSGKTDSRGKEICNAGIDSVVDQRKLVERLFAILNMLKNSFLVLSLVLGMAAVVLIAVTVRVAAFARRKETQIMKLVGASNTYIRLPFLAEGVVAGLLGTMVAFALLGGGMYYLGRVRHQVSFLQLLPIAGIHELYESCVVLLFLGVAVSALASLLALRKYVRV